MTTQPTITCFGEVLWDVLPTSKQPGGAPMNVAADLRNFGIRAQLISRVGTDEPGRELLDFLDQKGLPPDLIQVGQTQQTGVAKANISDTREVTYELVEPVAWDYIHLETNLMEAVRKSDLFVYGSLAARSPQTHETLLALLAVARQKVFDVNLRPPHYKRATVEDLLHQADIAKLNEHELAELSGWYNLASAGQSTDLNQTMRALRERYQLETVCVTLGEKGAALLDQNGLVTQAGFPVEVADTIGSGDAFLAAFLYKRLRGESPQQILAFACATGAYVATQPGATPTFSGETIVHTMQQASVL